MATLTSTGNVNLTSSTNWSPAQIPVAGDDLIIGAHTLTLDADMSLNTITLNSGSTRFAISGTSRSVQATNGFYIAVSIGSQLITTAIPTGTSLTLTGQWGGISFANLPAIAASTGGNLTLQTVGASTSSVLFADAGAGQRIITTSWTGGTLTTIGRFDMPSFSASNTAVSISGGTWTHTSIGTNILGAGSNRFCSVSGTGVLNWTGSVDSQSNLSGSGVFTFSGTSVTSTIGQTGDTFVQRNTAATTVTAMVVTATGTVTLTGRFSSRLGGYTFYQTGGVINYTNQTFTLPSGDYFTSLLNAGGTLNVSGLRVTSNKGIMFVAYGSAVITSDANTLFTCSSTAAFFGAYYNVALESKFVILESTPPTLPSVSNVAAGTTYGYAASLLTGTGIINDPAVISSAVGTALNNISSTALARFASVDTGQTSAAAGSVAALSAGSSSITMGPTVTRSLDDTRSITFVWPNSSDTITVTRSINGQDPFVSATGTAAFLQTIDGVHYWTLSYNSADRPTDEGSVRYRLSGTSGQKGIISLNVTNITDSSRNRIADSILKRNVSNVEASASEHTLATAILGMLEWEISGNDLIIKRTDGTTVHYTKTLSSATGTGEVITGLN